jgi:hypothetical protein
LTLVKIFHPLAQPRKRADRDTGGSHGGLRQFDAPPWAISATQEPSPLPPTLMKTADKSRRATRPQLHNLILGGIVQ